MEKLNDIIFYHIDKAIKSYRQFAQKQLKKAGLDLTIDQWLVLKAINDNKNVSQRDIAAVVFKDEASVTRIIDLLVTKGLLIRNFHATDRRKVDLQVTKSTKELLKKVRGITLKNRATALSGVEPDNIEIAKKVLISISANCTNK
ncbi:MAG TPA: MarR family transcriptional regulator [Puia sp.]|jgi:DNA-binding MarR family transcriptional regulator|nr:MarR family transcriptional regulator [Puia sp.]